MSNDCFETFLQTLPVDFTFKLPGNLPQGTWDFYLNPRYLRGSDFLMRWSQGRWAEHIIVDAIKRTNEFIPLPYGRSGVAPEGPGNWRYILNGLTPSNRLASDPRSHPDWFRDIARPRRSK